MNSSVAKGNLTKVRNVIGDIDLHSATEEELKQKFTQFYANKPGSITEREANIRISLLPTLGRSVGFKACDLNVDWDPDTQIRKIETKSKNSTVVDAETLAHLIN